MAGLAKIVDAAHGRGAVAVASPEGPPDLEAEAVLDPAIDPRVPRAPWPPRQIFVTGGTGYLGAFIVRELMRRTDARVRCLVRGKTSDEAFGRLRQVLVDYGLWEDRFEARLAVETGDLSRPCLGLTVERFDALAKEVDAVYHSGALVNFAYPYRNPSLRASNVLGTQEVLRLAALGTRKPFHHVSTTAVFGSSNYPSGTVVREGDEPVPRPASATAIRRRSGWRKSSCALRVTAGSRSPSIARATSWVIVKQAVATQTTSFLA